MSPSCLGSSSRDDRLGGGSRRIPIDTPSGRFEVWTKRTGNNPSLRLLFLHGGPGSTHEYFEAADSWLPEAGIEYYYYDQLGSGFSDNPDDESLWDLDRFVDEVEQVRTALGLERDNFVLLGHSWGGMLAAEYALAHGEHLKGLVISNMMMDVPAYNAYARDVLMPAMDQQALAEIQGPSELGISPSATLAGWSRFEDLARIDVPALVIGAAHDTMDPAHMQRVADRLPQGTYLHCPNGGHMAMYDDQETYFRGLVGWLKALG